MPLSDCISESSKIILGKNREIKLAISCLLAEGHLLIEDLPGVGKTTLALTLAKVFGLQFIRLQFTSDLLPADVTGISIYDNKNNCFDFHPGPIFTQVLLADEINRATPKTQSALLEAMEEHKVSVDGKTYRLPEPFFVIATQNPGTQIGTYSLPESQLDRFLMRIEMGYPDSSAEKRLLSGQDPRLLIEKIKTTISAPKLLELQQAVTQVHTSEDIINYILQIVEKSRNEPSFLHGLSPRAGMALKKASQSWAFIHNRDYVLPEDIQAVFSAVCNHRLQCNHEQTDKNIKQLTNEMIQSIEV
ncbi:MAG: MoxR family ATPase [Gammaproteobacteria bacterium]|nr:MoxR family ATPase [Gammaproteobacteria bacterium]